MKFLNSPLFGILIIIVFIFGIMFLIASVDSRCQTMRTECERKNGTWLEKEHTCVALPRIHLDNQ